MEPEWEHLSPDTLRELACMYARNWQTLDGLWFGNVEAEFGLDAATRIDLRNWERQSVVEAERIKRVLGLLEGGLANVLRVLSFMSWQVASPGFRIDEQTAERIVFSYPRCTVQEGREKRGKAEFPCRTMKTLLLGNVARVVEPRARLACLLCPPGPHPEDAWCRWDLKLETPVC